jgi:WD40-like Beta Propeller Repeat
MRVVFSTAVAVVVLLSAACGSGGRDSGPGRSRGTTVAVAAQSGTSSGPLGGFVSLRSAAASISRQCAASVGAGFPPGSGSLDFAVWVRARGRPLVYSLDVYATAASGERGVALAAFSSRGLLVPLGYGSVEPFALWPCRPPVAFYQRGEQLWMKVLAPARGDQKTVPLSMVAPRNLSDPLQGLAFDGHGRVAQVRGRTIRYRGGPTLAASGIPRGWRIERLAPSPRDPRTFVADTYSSANCYQANLSRLYLITPKGTARLASYGECASPVTIQWSPGGSRFLWISQADSSASRASLYVSDSTGRHRRLVHLSHGQFAAIDTNALWSPDGSRIAYGYETGNLQVPQVAVVDVASGAIHVLTHNHYRRLPSPYQPAEMRVLAWSPNGKELLILDQSAGPRRTVIEAIPASGGKPRVLVQIPLSSS